MDHSELSRGYICTFLLALGTQHPQSCFATEAEGGCTCSQVFPVSATCCRKFYSMNILRHCPSDFVAELVPGYTCNFLVSQSLQHLKEVFCCQCEWKYTTCSRGFKVVITYGQLFLVCYWERACRVHDPLTGEPSKYSIRCGNKAPWLADAKLPPLISLPQ